MSPEREWKQIEYDRFWEVLGPALFSEERRAAAVDEVTQLIALSGMLSKPLQRQACDFELTLGLTRPFLGPFLKTVVLVQT